VDILSILKTNPVTKNAFVLKGGTADMAGNVREWNWNETQKRIHQGDPGLARPLLRAGE